MTLETIYFITQIIAVVLIFPTLVFLAVQNRQSQKQMARANEIARAEYSGSIMRTNMELLARMVDDVELGRAFHQLTIENKRIEDTDTLFRLLTWFQCYSTLWLDMVAAHKKGLVDEEVEKKISGAQAFHLTFPVVWNATLRIFAQRELESENLDAMMSAMAALREKAQTRKPDIVVNFGEQSEARDASAEKPLNPDREPNA